MKLYTWLKPEINFKQVILKYGYPIISKSVADCVYGAKSGSLSRMDKLNGVYKMKDGTPSLYNCSKWKYLLDAPFNVSHKCCDVMKKAPVHKYEKESGNKPLLATMASESILRKNNWLKHGCNSFDKRPKSQPMSFWTDQDVLLYLKEFNIPYASVYGDILEDDKGNLYTSGCRRTGCIFCGFGCHLEKEPNRFQKLKETHPKLWNYCMKPIEDGGLGMRAVLEFIGVKAE